MCRSNRATAVENLQSSEVRSVQAIHLVGDLDDLITQHGVGQRSNVDGVQLVDRRPEVAHEHNL
jgi:hypothetical protein